MREFGSMVCVQVINPDTGWSFICRFDGGMCLHHVNEVRRTLGDTYHLVMWQECNLLEESMWGSS